MSFVIRTQKYLTKAKGRNVAGHREEWNWELGSYLIHRGSNFLSHQSYSLGLSHPLHQLNVCHNHREDLLKCTLLGSSPEMSHQSVWRGAWEFAFFISSQVMVLLLVWAPTLRNIALHQLVHRAGRWPPELTHFQVTALATRRDSPLVLLPTSWETGLPSPVGVPYLPWAISYGQTHGWLWAYHSSQGRGAGRKPTVATMRHEEVFHFYWTSWSLHHSKSSGLRKPTLKWNTI